MAYNYRIHPAIGIARVGNSEDYYLGPETMAGLGDANHTRGLPIRKGQESQPMPTKGQCMSKTCLFFTFSQRFVQVGFFRIYEESNAVKEST